MLYFFQLNLFFDRFVYEQKVLITLVHQALTLPPTPVTPLLSLRPFATCVSLFYDPLNLIKAICVTMCWNWPLAHGSLTVGTQLKTMTVLPQVVNS